MIILNIIDLLYKTNDWWQTGKVNNVFLYKRIRSEFSLVIRNIENQKVIMFSGPRRVGKSALLYQTVDFLLKDDVPPSRILMLCGDDPALSIENLNIREIMDAYSVYILHENLNALTQPIYVLIDEVQLFKYWRIYLKYYHDAGFNIKFFVCGPAAIRQNGGELLPMDGLFEDIVVMPLSQQQFTDFYCLYKNTEFDLIKYKSLLPDVSFLDDPAAYYAALYANRIYFNEFKAGKLQIVNEYLLSGGYPGFFAARSVLEWQKTLAEDSFDRMLLRDIVGANNVKGPFILRKLIYFIAESGGQELSYSGIGDLLDIDTVTVKNYVTYLSRNGYINVLENGIGGRGGVIRKNRKIFLSDSGLRNALLHKAALTQEDIPPLVKSSCVSTAADYGMKRGCNVCFWRDGNYEADVVIDYGRHLLPVNAPFRNQMDSKGLKRLYGFVKNNRAKAAVAVTQDILEKNDSLYLIPYWML